MTGEYDPHCGGNGWIKGVRDGVGEHDGTIVIGVLHTHDPVGSLPRMVVTADEAHGLATALLNTLTNLGLIHDPMTGRMQAVTPEMRARWQAQADYNSAEQPESDG